MMPSSLAFELEGSGLDELASELVVTIGALTEAVNTKRLCDEAQAAATLLSGDHLPMKGTCSIQPDPPFGHELFTHSPTINKRKRSLDASTDEIAISAGGPVSGSLTPLAASDSTWKGLGVLKRSCCAKADPRFQHLTATQYDVVALKERAKTRSPTEDVHFAFRKDEHGRRRPALIYSRLKSAR